MPDESKVDTPRPSLPIPIQRPIGLVGSGRRLDLDRLALPPRPPPLQRQPASQNTTIPHYDPNPHIRAIQQALNLIVVPPTPQEVAREAEERQQLDQELEAERRQLFGTPRYGPDPRPAPPIVFFDLEDDDAPNPPRREVTEIVGVRRLERAALAAALTPDGQRRVTASLVVQQGIRIGADVVGPLVPQASSLRASLRSPSRSPPPRARQLSDYTRAVDLERDDDT